MNAYAFLVFVLIAFSGNQQKEPAQIPPQEFKKVLKEYPDIQLVDVRTLREYQSGYIDKTQLIDFYREGFNEKILKLDKNKPIAVYCAVGKRSGSTARFLRKNGFKKVYDLKGGIFAWSRKGYKIIKE